jgi:GTP-binding protein EngB required for normal cell division
MFRGSAYSIETDKEWAGKSEVIEEEVRVALVGVSDVGKSSILGCMEVTIPECRMKSFVRTSATPKVSNS